jgi:hypothetical protein
MAVGYDGNVLKEVRLNDTIKLGTQQAYTTYLSNLLGNEFNNYTDVKLRMAVLYLKTVKGGVFGSAYMAPPSVMTAAYATSTTTIQTTETSVEQLIVPSYETTIATWTATVVIDNPDHWPVETYVGVAFMRQQPTSFGMTSYGCGVSGWGGWITPGMEGIPEWAIQPGLQAVDQNNRIRTVSQRDVLLPKWVARKLHIPGPNQRDCRGGGYMGWEPALYGIGVARFSRLGPTYIATPDGGERFEPRMMMPRLIFSTITYYSTSITHFIVNCLSGEGFFCFTTYTYSFATSTGTSISDLRDNQYATFPYKIRAESVASISRVECGCHVTYTCGCDWVPHSFHWINFYRLAYIKVVDLWNVTNILAYLAPENPEDTTIRVKADRPLGIAAIYVYDSTDVTQLPAPYIRPSYTPRKTIYSPAVCFDVDDLDKGITFVKEDKVVGEGEQPPDSLTVTFYLPNSNCEGFVVPSGSGTYDPSQLTPCPKDGNTATCNVPSGSVATASCPPGS